MSFIQKIADGAKHLGSRARDFGGIAGDKAKDFTKKSSELLEYSRMKREMRKMEREMENNLAGLGALYYQQQSGKDNVEEEIQRLLASTRELELEMKQLEVEIAAMQPSRPVCPACNKELPDDGKFCSYCGKLVVEE